MNYPPGTIQQAASQLKDHLVTNLPWTFIRMFIWLVVLTILENMKVNGKDYPIYYGIKNIFETTNQSLFTNNINKICEVQNSLPILDTLQKKKNFPAG